MPRNFHPDLPGQTGVNPVFLHWSVRIISVFEHVLRFLAKEDVLEQNGDDAKNHSNTEFFLTDQCRKTGFTPV